MSRLEDGLLADVYHCVARGKMNDDWDGPWTAHIVEVLKDDWTEHQVVIGLQFLKEAGYIVRTGRHGCWTTTEKTFDE